MKCKESYLNVDSLVLCVYSPCSLVYFLCSFFSLLFIAFSSFFFSKVELKCYESVSNMGQMTQEKKKSGQRERTREAEEEKKESVGRERQIEGSITGANIKCMK